MCIHREGPQAVVNYPEEKHPATLYCNFRSNSRKYNRSVSKLTCKTYFKSAILQFQKAIPEARARQSVK
jgi:hypothetical protein